MATVEPNQQESNGFRAHELDESRSTTSIDQVKSGEVMKSGNEVQDASFPARSGGYGGVGEQSPLHHTSHTDGEHLPKPRSDLFADKQSTESYYDSRATKPESGDLLKSSNQVRESSFPGSGGYGVVSEQERPRHTIHTDDELVPKPRSKSFADEQNTKSYQDASEPESIESYQDSRSTEPESVDETESDHSGATKEKNGALYDRQTFSIGRDKEIARVLALSKIKEPSTFENGSPKTPKGYHDTHAVSELPGSPRYDRDGSEPTKDDTDADAEVSQFPGASTGTKVTQRGYGYDQEDNSVPTLESVPESAPEYIPEHGAEHPAKKEGFMAKMMEKLPGHHQKSAKTSKDQGISTETEPSTVENGAAKAPNGYDQEEPALESGPNHGVEHPAKKEGFMAKMMEKLPSHHHKSAEIPKDQDVPIVTPEPSTFENDAAKAQEENSEPALESGPKHGAEHPAKKEGFMAKLMEKLPSHHNKSGEITTPEHDSSTPEEHHDTATSSPRKGLMAQIMEKLPGHHASTTAHGTTA